MPTALVLPLQFACVVSNLEGFQEYPNNAGKQASWYSPNFEIKNSKLPILTSPGLGVSYDEDIWKKAEKV
jgi:hypothetical protein